MDQRQESALAAFRRIQWLLDQHAELLGNLNASEPRQEFDQLVARIEAIPRQQDDAKVRSESLTAQKNQLKESLFIDHLQPIVSIVHANPEKFPSMQTVRLPAAHGMDVALLAAAGAMADMAAKYHGAFVRAGLPEDFVDELRTAAHTFMRLGVERDYTKQQWSGFGRALDYHIDRGWVVFGALKALARKALRRHPELLAEFSQAKLHRPRPALPRARLALPPGAPTNAERSSVAIAPAEAPRERKPMTVVARLISFVHPAA